MVFSVPDAVSVAAPRMQRESEKQDAAGAVNGFPSADVAAAQALWREVCALPLVAAGRLSRSSADFCTLRLETADVDCGTRPTFDRTVHLPSGAACGAPLVIADGTKTAHASPSGKLSVRFVPFKESKTDFRVDVWAEAAPLHSVSAKNVHGKVMEHALHQIVSWAADESSFVYVAERKVAKTCSWFDVDGSLKAPAQAAYEAGTTWGEANSAHATLSLFVCDVAAGTVRNVLPDGFTDQHSATMPVLFEQLGVVAFVAHPHEPRRLGLEACPSHPNALYTVALPQGDAAAAPVLLDCVGKAKNLTRRPGSNAFACLVAAPGDEHMSCSALHLVDVAARSSVEVVPLVRAPLEGDHFPGLYAIGGSSDLSWASATTVLVNSVRRSGLVLYAVDVVSKAVALVRQTAGAGTWKVLDNDGARVLVVHSRTSQPPVVRYCADILAPDARFAEAPVFAAAASTPALSALAAPLSAAVYCPGAADDGVKARTHDSEYILSAAAGADKTMVVTHGGPHVADTDMFARSTWFYLLCGFKLLSVNYGGSLGFGQARVEELLGHVGTNDVGDVISCVEHAVAHADVDASKLYVTGGSHGGFLTAHLTGQRPAMFRAAAMRNPVTCISSMIHETDIPEWCAVEGGVAANPRFQWTAGDVAKLFTASPMAHAAAVTTPTLICIGAQDMRVPPPQGWAWYHALKANGKCDDVRVNVYPADGHGLRSVAAEGDGSVHIALFFQHHQ
jgi:acylaminoacyl-peptidase